MPWIYFHSPEQLFNVVMDSLKCLMEITDSEYYSFKVTDTEGVYVVPAFAAQRHLIGICMSGCDL